MTNQDPQVFADVPQLDYRTIQKITIVRRNHNSDNVEITNIDKTILTFYAKKYGKDGIIALVKQIRAAAKERNMPYFSLNSGRTLSADDHVFYFNAPSKIKKLTDAQKRALATFAKQVHRRAWYVQYGLALPRSLERDLAGEKGATNISTLRKLCEYGLIGTNSEMASTWREWHITKAGLAYVEANMPEDAQAAKFTHWDELERQAMKRESHHVTNHVICKNIASGYANIELGNVGNHEEDPFSGTKFKWVLGGRTYAILHNSTIEIVTKNYNCALNDKSAFIGKDDALAYANALQQIAALFEGIKMYYAHNS